MIGEEEECDYDGGAGSGWMGMKGYRSASWVQTACGRGRIVGQFFRLQMSSVGAPNLVGIDPFERLV